MYIVTGGLGFIGSNIVRELHMRGERILIVENRKDRVAEKMKNISGCMSNIIDIVDIERFIDTMHDYVGAQETKGIFHQGACADTTLTDAEFVLKRNTDFSTALIDSAFRKGKPIVYASSAAVYGNSTDFREIPENENPLNVYGLSKLLVDNGVRLLMERQSGAGSTIVGLRYFNVYGKGEDHKGKMASMITQIRNQFRESGKCKLFKTDDYQPPLQRDFVHVDDVVDVNMHFMFGPRIRGIFNVGTGQARSFEAVAKAIEAAIASYSKYDFDIIDMPPEIRKFYQRITKADLTSLRTVGKYDKTFMDIFEGTKKTFESYAREPHV